MYVIPAYSGMDRYIWAKKVLRFQYNTLWDWLDDIDYIFQANLWPKPQHSADKSGILLQSMQKSVYKSATTCANHKPTCVIAWLCTPPPGGASWFIWNYEHHSFFKKSYWLLPFLTSPKRLLSVRNTSTQPQTAPNTSTQPKTWDHEKFSKLYIFRHNLTF